MMKMLSFQLSAIDLVLVIAVIVLFVLYLKKFTTSFPEEKQFRKLAAKELATQELASQESSQKENRKGFIISWHKMSPWIWQHTKTELK